MRLNVRILIVAALMLPTSNTVYGDSTSRVKLATRDLVCIQNHIDEIMKLDYDLYVVDLSPCPLQPDVRKIGDLQGMLGPNVSIKNKTEDKILFLLKEHIECFAAGFLKPDTDTVLINLNLCEIN